MRLHFLYSSYHYNKIKNNLALKLIAFVSITNIINTYFKYWMLNTFYFLLIISLFYNVSSK